MSRYNPQVSVFFTAQPTAVTGPRGIAKKSCTTPLFFSSLSLYIYICICICIYIYSCRMLSDGLLTGFKPPHGQWRYLGRRWDTSWLIDAMIDIVTLWLFNIAMEKSKMAHVFTYLKLWFSMARLVITRWYMLHHIPQLLSDCQPCT